MTEKTEICRNCGRKIYSDRPSCMYCGVERNLDATVKTAMKKRIVEKALGKDVEDMADPEILAGAQSATVHGDSYKLCPRCGEHVPAERNFCSACGQNVRNVSVSSSSVLPKRKPEPSANFEMSLPTYVAVSHDSSNGIDTAIKSPGIILIAVSMLFFCIAVFVPFGIIPSGGFRGYYQSRFHMPASVFLMYLLNYAFIYMSLFSSMSVESEKKAFRIIHGATLLTCFIGGPRLFASISRILEISILSVPVHFIALRAIVADKSRFWTVCCVVSAVTLLIITPYARRLYLPEVPIAPAALPGFIFHCIGASLLFLGTLIRALSSNEK